MVALNKPDFLIINILVIYLNNGSFAAYKYNDIYDRCNFTVVFLSGSLTNAQVLYLQI